jgi:hypothetical protein
MPAAAITASRLTLVSSFPLIILSETIFASNGVFSLQGGQFSDVFNQQRDMLYWIRIN